MKIKLVTEREIDPADLDKWLRMYRDQRDYPIDPEELKVSRTATWTTDCPALRTTATSSITLEG
jgi:hypothetical protein